jgi:glycine oxidase
MGEYGSMSRHLVVIGAGAVGLSIAWRASRDGIRTTIVDRGSIGRGTTWASAGMLPYANIETARHPLDRLAAVGHALHFEWQPELIEQSGIDYELERNGTLHLAESRVDKAALSGLEQHALDESIPAKRLSLEALAQLIPDFAQTGEFRGNRDALLFPQDAQLRPPRFTEALSAACEKNGVAVVTDAGDVALTTVGRRVTSAKTANCGCFDADDFVVAAGTWTGELLRPLGIEIRFIPIRGQIVFYQLPRRAFPVTIYEGGNYLVSRRDGALLIGSTLEDVGFDVNTTDEALAALRGFGSRYVPEVGRRKPDLAWAGLRPGTFDGFPYIGPATEYENLMVAAGHFRSGIQLAPVTAHAVCALLDGREPQFDLSPFRPSRG